jgi:hypothetical protein
VAPVDAVSLMQAFSHCSAMTFKVHLEVARSGRTFMLRLEIASPFVLTLKIVRIPEDEWSPRGTSRVGMSLSHHNHGRSSA